LPSSSFRDLADDPLGRLRTEADLHQLLFQILNRIRLQCNRVVCGACAGLLPARVLLRVFEGRYRDAYDRVFVAIILALVNLERVLSS
jgi:hypothetical protein